MILKIALLLWFVAFALALFTTGKARSLMGRLFIAGFCLLILGMFLKIISRVL